MKTTFLVATILNCTSVIAFAQQKKDTVKLINRPADIGLIYPISTNGVQAAHYNNKISLQAIAGVSGAITNCAVAGVANIIKGNARGGLFAGVLNITGNNVEGAQFAGIANLVKNNTTGIQSAGLLNVSGSIRGVQLSGLGNIIYKNSKAVQIAGLFNRSANTHTQIAGLINIAKKVTGVQISGLINIADSSDYAIGFINLIKNGEKSFGVSTDENLNTMLSFYSGGRVLYGIIGIGYNLKSGDNFYALQTGLGGHLLTAGSHFRLSLEAMQLVQTNFKHGDRYCFKYTLQVLPEIKINQHFALFAGPTANILMDYSHQKFYSLTNHYVWTRTGHNGNFMGSYFGITGGLKIIL